MIIQGNAFRLPLANNSAHCIVTSPPYWGLRDYNLPPMIFGGRSDCRHQWGELNRPSHSGQVPQTKWKNNNAVKDGQNTNTGQFCILCNAWLGNYGLEPAISLYVQHSVEIARELRRVLRNDGVMWWNLGDSYATGKNGRSAADTKKAGNDDRTFRDKPFSVTELPAKNLCLIPFRVALALQDDGWILRSEIPWLKANAMPSSVTDRPGTAHEHVFMLVKSARYYYDGEAVRRGQSSNSHGGNGANAGEKRRLLQYGSDGTLGQTPHQVNNEGRALRTSDPFFDSLDSYIAHLQDVRDNGGMLVDSEGLPAALVVNTASYKSAHYATFAPKLIAPLIQTTPEKVCPNCGKPWQRVVEKEAMVIKRSDRNNHTGNRTGASGTMVSPPRAVTTGWQPTCKCIQKRAPNFGMKGSELLELADEVARELAPIGAIVLDPFCGSGTCGQVARELGRRFIGIDLSAIYLQENALPRAEKLTSQKSLSQLPMFKEAA